MRRNFWISLFAVLLTGLYGCSQEELTKEAPGETGEQEILSGETGYIAIQLSDAEAVTRASDTHKEYDDDYEHYEWFNEGSKGERAIINDSTANRVLFFNKDYSFYGSSKIQATTAGENVYVGRKPAVKQPNTPLPALALVIVNGDPNMLNKLESELSSAGATALKKTLNYLKNPGDIGQYDQYFTMTSAIYMDNNDDRNVTGATVIPEKFKFYDTIDEAIRPENLLRFYVERVLAKFTLRVKDAEGDEITFGQQGKEPIILPRSGKLKVRQVYAPSEDESKDVMSDWSISLGTWGMNGLEKNTYLFKTLAVQDPGNYPWKIGTDFYSRWNEPRLFRSYWAIDENYDKGLYPDQYRQALDVEGITPATTNHIYSSGYAEKLQPDNYTLIYRSYENFEKRKDDRYAVENTFDASVLDGKDYNTSPWLRSGTHFILTAQLLVNDLDKDAIDRMQIDEKGFIEGVSDKYFSNGLYWSEDALLQQAVATLMTNLYYNKEGDSYKISNVLGEGYVDYINENGKPPLDTDCPVEDGDGNLLTHDFLMGFDEKTGELNVYNYFKFAPAFIKGGDGWVTLKKKDEVTLYARYIDGSTRKITDEQLVSYIYRFTNLAKHYKEGRMYYALPVRHNLDSTNFETGRAKVSTGDYGVVRNTWYRLTLTHILSPGTPVDDPEQPIVPYVEPDDKSLGVEVEIIPWREVDITVDQLH